MKSVYRSPLRVYLILGLLALIGIYSGYNLPVSLFPNSSKPRVYLGFDYGGSTAEEFLHNYGSALEYQLNALDTDDATVEQVEATYRSTGVRYMVEFKWGNSPTHALRELENTVQAFSARFPEEIRDSRWLWIDNENSGFFAASFYSPKKGLHEVYDIIEPILAPQLSKVEDAQDPSIFNPNEKEIKIELLPEALASLQLFPSHIERAVRMALQSFSGGSIVVGTKALSIQTPRQAQAIEELNNVLIPTPKGGHVHLSDIARIDFGPQTNARRIFKTSGATSLILFANPKPGGNVKKMSEDIIEIIKKSEPQFAKDIQYKILVDPSEFIRASVQNVLNEVFLAAGIAVAILFLFIGSFRNVITAAIEIPLSMVLAFILMRYFEMNLNLISLGGLALSAGMNVDASVVVMENIFRHFEMHSKKQLSYSERLEIIVEAVKEVSFPVIASTISSLVVFLPLAFTSDLTFAILGDLAKAVVFSHGFSAFVALILVPTIRLQLMSKGDEKPVHSPIERQLKKVELWYGYALEKFIRLPLLKWGSYALAGATLLLMTLFLLPKLPKEIVGKPDTDWLLMSINTQGNTLVRQMETQAEIIERDALEQFGDEILYTFNQIRDPNRATLMLRLKDKSKMRDLWKRVEGVFRNSALLRFHVFPWNPSELPIPDPPHMRIAIRGRAGDQDKAKVARQISDLMNENEVFPQSIWTEPNIGDDEAITLTPHQEQWGWIQQRGYPASMPELTDLVRIATEGRRIGRMPVDGTLTDIQARFLGQYARTAEEVGALPIGIGSKIIPLKALATVTVESVKPPIYHENLQDLVLVLGRHKVGEEAKIPASLEKAQKLIDDWTKKNGSKYKTTITLEDSNKDLNSALEQLATAVGISVLLIFVTMVFQFGSVALAVIVLVSVLLGFIGVIGSLYVFGSTLSLNSVLGVILLNGIAVANSIILVDFILKLEARGMKPEEAAVTAATRRLRPILITSLTTILGMLPIAVGMGEGGRILQPLGITVSAGLWVSTCLTLFLVPALQVTYLNWRNQRQTSTRAVLIGEPAR